MSPPALSFRHIVKRYGSAVALAGVELQIASGEFFGLAGMNGAGKTTLIKCLLDATRADEGDIEIFGSPSRETVARRHLAFLPERFNAPFYATGRDFLRLMARLYGTPFDEGVAAGMLDQLDLDRTALDRPVRSYSKGMTQKLGLCAVLLSGRSLLLLDEPTSGLDPKARALLKAALRTRHAAGATIFFTSHALADVDEMCDRMAVLHHGALRYAGTPAELRRRTAADTLEQAFLRVIEAKH
ncbi:MAG: ABC transporter ATP-binding protein [Burkholderiales bacterium]|nr:ABC transporter ATP-binding protein [Burkholderiales bacterium]